MSKGIAYLKAFQAAKESLGLSVKLYGDHLIVEQLNKQVETKSGIVLASDEKQLTSISANSAVLARVLMAGEGYYDKGEDGEDISIPLEVEAGDIVLVGRNSIGNFSQIGSFVAAGKLSIGICTASEVMMHFKGEEALDKFLSTLSDVE